MKFILFCKLPYAFSILKPLEEEIYKRDFECVWYVPEEIIEKFPYTECNIVTNIRDLRAYKSDAVMVPGNEVPYYLNGIKVQIFHGMAGEKKGHFRIRDYFDLYLTQGPYFTEKFKEFQKKYKNFEVVETGWSKLDSLFKKDENISKQKSDLLNKYNVKKIILYAPTFSPSLTSGSKLLNSIETLSKNKDILVIVKFHDLMDKQHIRNYKKLEINNLIISDKKNIVDLMLISDLMISDTSSTVYEYILLDKPVITFDNKSENNAWCNLTQEKDVVKTIYDVLDGDDEYKEERNNLIKYYHPYVDAKSSERMIDAVIKNINEYTSNKPRKLSIYRKIKIHSQFGIS